MYLWSSLIHSDHGKSTLGNPAPKGVEWCGIHKYEQPLLRPCPVTISAHKSSECVRSGKTFCGNCVYLTCFSRSLWHGLTLNTFQASQKLTARLFNGCFSHFLNVPPQLPQQKKQTLEAFAQCISGPQFLHLCSLTAECCAQNENLKPGTVDNMIAMHTLDAVLGKQLSSRATRANKQHQTVLHRASYIKPIKPNKSKLERNELYGHRFSMLSASECPARTPCFSSPANMAWSSGGHTWNAWWSSERRGTHWNPRHLQEMNTWKKQQHLNVVIQS